LSQLNRTEECESTIGYIKGMLYRQWLSLLSY
jgi:hypothetical protein